MLFFNECSKSILRRIFITTIIFICIISVTFYIPGSPYIRCVQCSSDKSPSCIDKPPQPISCLKKERFCQTVTKTNKNGSVISLLRDCASVTSQDCVRGDGIIVCTSTCDQPGCNQGDSPYPSFLTVALLLLTWVFISLE